MNSYDSISIKSLGIISLIVVMIFGTSYIFKMFEAKKMIQTAEQLIHNLDAQQREKAVLEFDDPWRFKWGYLPTPAIERKGLKIKEMNEKQQALAFDLLKTGLSSEGYHKVSSILDLEIVLFEKSGQAHRDPELYYFSIYGKPSMTEPWGWKMEGHHISLNYTVVKGELISMVPRFFGSNPAEVREGPKKGLRVLKEEEDGGLALIQSLDQAQQQIAIFEQEAFPDIVTGNASEVEPLSNEGIKVAQLTETQQNQLKGLIQVYLSSMPNELASKRFNEIEAAGFENIYFGWAGGTERDIGHYYRIQGPSFLLEYDKTQNNVNHVHTVWRDFNGDFGRDILKDHYLGSH